MKSRQCRFPGKRRESQCQAGSSNLRAGMWSQPVSIWSSCESVWGQRRSLPLGITETLFHE